MSLVAKLIKSITDAPNISFFMDAADLQTLILQYEQMLTALKALVAKEKDTITSAGYTAIVQAAITVHQDRINDLKARLAGETITPDEISFLVSQYTNQLDSYAYLGKQLCTGKFMDELSSLLPDYKAVLANLIQLNTNSAAAIQQSGYAPIVTGSITLHTVEIQSLELCVPIQLNIPANGIITGCRVNDVIDGDTLEIDVPASIVPPGAEPRINIRLAGCNAPEKPETTSQAGTSTLEYTYDNVSSFMYVDRKFYSEATMKLGTLLGGKVVTLAMNKSKPYDSYSRLVAVVTRDDGIVANEEMLKAGLCAYFHRPEWNSPDDPVDHSKYISLESEAKVAKAGVWVTPASEIESGKCIITAMRKTATGGTTATSAIVYVDSIFMGMTSTTEPFTIATGEHEVKVVSSQYGTGTSTLTITKDSISTLNVIIGESSTDPEEPEQQGFITFQALRTTSAGEYVGTTAEVWENNRFRFMVSSTKDRVPTPVGEYTYVFKKDGYEDTEVTVTVEDDTEVLAKALMESTETEETPENLGKLDFVSVPTGAKIYLNDDYIGLTKKSEYELPPGVYTVWIKKTGFVDFTQSVLVKAGKKEIVDATLTSTTSGTIEDPIETPQEGVVDFVSSPSGAYIYLNNVYIGMTKKTGYKVTAGVHLVTFRKNGYDEWEDTIGVVANERLVVESILQKTDVEGEEEESEEEVTPPTNVGWYNYPNPNYSSTSQQGYSYDPMATSQSTSLTTAPSPTNSEPTSGEEDEGMPVQIVILKEEIEEEEKEKLTDIFKEVATFFKKYCDTKLKFIATTQEEVESDVNDDEEETFDDINTIEDQIDLDKIHDEKGIVVLMWIPSGSSVASKGETLTRDEPLNRSIVCSIPYDEYFNKEISGTRKTHLGITAEGGLSMAITISNALLEWYLDEHEAEEENEDEEIPELDKEFCNIKEKSDDRPTAKCIKKWLKKYNKKAEE